VRRIAFCVLCWSLLPACHRPRTPERVCAALLQAVSEGDAGAVFDNLLDTTQWALMGVQKNHHRMHELIESSYPATEREAALARLYGATADSGRDLFIRLYPDRYAPAFLARIKAASGPESAAKVRPNPERAGEFFCQLGDSAPFRLAQAASGRFGLAELDSDWAQAQLRTIHDLETVEMNANLYRRVHAPSAK
jgi:hypothetical protein